MHELRRGEEIFPFARLNKVDNARAPPSFLPHPTFPSLLKAPFNRRGEEPTLHNLSFPHFTGKHFPMRRPQLYSLSPVASK